MDNRLFNVNGEGDDMLFKTLELAFLQWGGKTTCKGWKQTKENGLILCWWCGTDRITPMPAGLTAEECFSFVTAWLKSDFAKTVDFGRWCEDSDHDGHNGMGWQVYCEDWGHVGGENGAIVAVRPAYMWYGK